MFGDKHWSKSRWAACGLLGLGALWLVGLGVQRLYRGYTADERVASGRVLFEHEWQPNDTLAGGGDGLGPVFNEKSCVACHFQGGHGGGGPNTKNVAAFEVFPTLLRPEMTGGVVHASATRPEWRETFERVGELFPIIPGGTTIVSGCISKTADFNPVVAASINSPALFGAGLIDGVSSWSIHGDGLLRSAQVIAKELSADFSAAQVGRVRKLSGGRVGKFGWKGQFATLEEFVATACAVELGLTNPQKSQMAPGEFREDATAALDMTARQLDQLVSFVAALPRPVEILPDDPGQRAQAIRGKVVFAEVGCAECHTPNVDNVEGVYSDFRLYELEPERAGSYADATLPIEPPADHPKPGEWKTPPLWGVADSAPYFHDGASATLTQAILRHSGAARPSLDHYRRLTLVDRQALVSFLETLRAPQ